MKFIDIIKKCEKECVKNGPYGIEECKKEINRIRELSLAYDDTPLNLFDLLDSYYYKANNDIFFNKNMLYACWLLVQELWEKY